MNDLTINIFQPLYLRIEGNVPFPANPYEDAFQPKYAGRDVSYLLAF
jgi:hypothetical protein